MLNSSARSKKTQIRVANNYGFTLVETLIAAGILVTVMLASISMVNSQQKEIRSLMQKTEAVELKNLMTEVFANSIVCTGHLKDLAVDVASASTTTTSPTVLNLSNIYYGDPVTSGPLASAGKALPLSQHGLVVDKISFKNILATGNPNEYKGQFEVSFTSDSMMRPIRPVRLEQIFKTTATGPTKIISCTDPSGDSSLANLIAKSCVKRTPAYVTKEECGIISNVQCEVDELALTGGGLEGKNTSLQNSYGAYNSQSQLVGWNVTWYGGEGSCTSLNLTPNGTTAPGSNPCFCNGDPEVCYCGTTMAYCCKVQ
jgi:type II secretory pathway pseudopilin PulG